MRAVIEAEADAIRAIDAVLVHLADAVEEGKKGRRAPEAKDGDEEAEPQQRRRSRRPATARAGDDGVAGEGESAPPAPAGAVRESELAASRPEDKS